jgi:hypothetical protein
MPDGVRAGCGHPVKGWNGGLLGKLLPCNGAPTVAALTLQSHEKLQGPHLNPKIRHAPATAQPSLLQSRSPALLLLHFQPCVQRLLTPAFPPALPRRASTTSSSPPGATSSRRQTSRRPSGRACSEVRRASPHFILLCLCSLTCRTTPDSLQDSPRLNDSLAKGAPVKGCSFMCLSRSSPAPVPRNLEPCLTPLPGTTRPLAGLHWQPGQFAGDGPRAAAAGLPVLPQARLESAAEAARDKGSSTGARCGGQRM